MAPIISVEAEANGEGWVCRVRVSEGMSETTTHTVSVQRAYFEKLAGSQAPVEQLVQRSFEFLLAREPKESILREFDLPLIARYFPEYERHLRGHI